MSDQTFQRTIKYEAELDSGFGREVAASPGGENLHACIQCGTCSGTCPLSIYMDYTPRRIIAMTRAGFKDEVLRSNTIWLCASCYSCTVECPKQIKITDVMYALKQKAIEGKVYAKRFTIPALAREFYAGVKKRGRNTESWLMTNVMLKTNPLELLRQSGLGLGLFTRGRMGIRPESIKNKGELRKILHAVEEETRGNPTASGDKERS
ncbi:MAG TPA: 4Fe-4S dicluster domain-containing protein [Sumerlaeia bacterium]|nr:4Fe-4S dicluster domain-containing protein [Sumerlaeia bacterium]